MTSHEHKSSYDFDLYQWSIDQATLLRNKKFTEIDIENIAEEIESLGGSLKDSLYSHLVRYFQHRLKIIYTPEKKGNSISWDMSILTSKQRIKRLIKKNPALKNELLNDFTEAYKESVGRAAIDSDEDENFFPDECPWTIEEILKEID